MWLRIKRVLSNKTVMLRLAFTLLILLIVRLLSHITIPLYNIEPLKQYFIENSSQGNFLAILNAFSGQGLERFSILALGISPYITASIVVQLFQMVIPTFKEWSEQGEAGKQKMNRVTRYLAIILAFVQGLVLIIGTSQFSGGGGLAALDSIIIINAYDDPSILSFMRIPIVLYMALIITAGTAISIWFADLITKKGIGNGTSMLIVAGIVTSLPVMLQALWVRYITVDGRTGWDIVFYVLILLLYIGILLGVVYMQIAQRKIPVQYANRQGKSDSNIPMKLNAAGVIPVIFAQTIMSIPLTVAGLIRPSTGFLTGLVNWINEIFNFQQPIGFMLYVFLIVVFSFFYSFLTISPDKIADNLSKGNAYIPGIRPGDETKDYVARLLFKITVIGTVYLVILAVLPILTALVFGFTGAEAQVITIGGTSLLIIVGVAIETTQQVETDASQAEYSGIFK